MKEKRIAAITSKIGCTAGNLKFQTITNTNQIK